MRNQIVTPRPASKMLALVRDLPLGARSALRVNTRRRLDNQLTRAFQHSFGAEQGLRVVVGIATREMIRSGASPDEMRQELTDVVTMHPANATTGPASVSVDSRVAGLTAMIVRWCRSATSASAHES